MLKGFGDVANLIKNARQIQDQVSTLKETLAKFEAEGVAGGGLVRIKGRGDGVILSVHIDEQTFSDGDHSMLEDLVAAAINSYQEKLTALRKDKLGELAKGMGLPPGMDLDI